MIESLQVSAQLTQVHEVDVTEVARLRARHKDAFFEREGVSSRPAVLRQGGDEALKLYPQVNAALDIEAGTVTYPDGEHLGIAVDTERGLIVPTIRTPATCPSRAWPARSPTPPSARAPTSLARRALRCDVLITNLGSTGALFDTPIINQPQVAILGVGAVVKRPVVVTDASGNDRSRAQHGVPGADVRPPHHRRRRRGPVPDGGQGAPVRGLLRGRARVLSMHVVVGGASGFLGTALVTHLRARGHEVTRLVRSGDPAGDASVWDPAKGRIDQVLVDRADAVVNLSGSPISQWPRTAKRKKEILVTPDGHRHARQGRRHVDAHGVHLRVRHVLVRRRPAGDVLTEADGPGTGFLADVSQQWEAAAAPAVEAGARTCFVRTSLVLSQDGGMLWLMLPAWKLGGGAPRSGRQHMSLISRTTGCAGSSPCSSRRLRAGQPRDARRRHQRRVHRRARRRRAPADVPGRSAVRDQGRAWAACPTTCSAHCASPPPR